MKTYINPTKDEFIKLTERPVIESDELENTVKLIFREVKSNGDKALQWYTKHFDKVEIDSFRIDQSTVKLASQKVDKKLKDAIQLAKINIEKFHASQKIEKEVITTTDGVECWQESRPIEKVGIYIPGGLAPLFSTVLMLAVPAIIAGCKEIVLCTPPNKQGEVDPAILFTAQLLGIDKIFKVGGIQAIGALTYGTESISQVNKIFGPGNQFVTAAKQYAQREGIAIDMPAGPSELLVVADESADVSFVASDLLSQAEHGEDSQVICVANNASFLKVLEKEVERQMAILPRKEIAKKAIDNSKLICLNNKQDSIDFINEYAPEHFIIMTQDTDFYINNIISAGSVFIGKYTPESAGDYASGTNHTLPTNGFAKAYSGVNLDAFVKKITFQRITEKGIRNIGPTIEIMAAAEGLDAHKNAVTVRLNQLKSQ
jgi:histidinol dehydrogenase